MSKRPARSKSILVAMTARALPTQDTLSASCGHDMLPGPQFMGPGDAKVGLAFGSAHNGHKGVTHCLRCCWDLRC